MGLTAVATRESLPAGGSITMRETAVYCLTTIKLTSRAIPAATPQVTVTIRHRARSRSITGSKPLSTSDICLILEHRQVGGQRLTAQNLQRKQPVGFKLERGWLYRCVRKRSFFSFQLS